MENTYCVWRWHRGRKAPDVLIENANRTEAMRVFKESIEDTDYQLTLFNGYDAVYELEVYRVF